MVLKRECVEIDRVVTSPALVYGCSMAVKNPGPLARATQALERRDFGTAEKIALDVLAREENPDALHLLAHARQKQNRADEALALIQRSLAVRPGHAGALLHLGKVLAQLDRDAEAVRALEDALLWDQSLADAWYELGQAQHRLGDFAGAENSFRKLLALEPRYLLGKLALGLVLRDRGQAGQAESLLVEGLVESGEALLKAGFAYNLALLQSDQGRKDAALSNFTLVSKLDPGCGAAELARAGILEEMQRPDEALALLEETIRREPLNEAIHAAYNDLLYRHGRDADFLKSYDRAPPASPLQMGKANFLLKTGRLDEAHALYAAIAAREPANLNAILGAAAALKQLGRQAEAFTALEGALARHPQSAALYHQFAATALAAREPERAAALAEQALSLAPLDQYGLALQGSAWRMLGDERDEILNSYDALIAVFDLEAPDGFSTMGEFNDELGALLNQLNPVTRAPLNQTLRGGSQTSGHLFDARHDLVEKLRARIAEALERYIGDIKPDARHPFRSRRGKGFRVAGSWSSLLRNSGYHVNHVHPEGWISSCYYVGVPQVVKSETEKQGWIKFGEPSFDTGLSPRRAIQPVSGRLVLFPSYMWHGTIPFHDASPRVTIAFDAVPRAQ
jgi:tetratricopeptide (TPR) repeat protein